MNVSKAMSGIRKMNVRKALSRKSLLQNYTMTIASGVWCAIVLSIIAAANTGNLSWAYELAQLIPLFDKLGHAFLYGGMSLVTGLALPSLTTLPGCSVVHQRCLPLGSWLIMLLSIVEEFSQLFLTHRNFDLLDLTVNVLAIAVGGVFANHCKRIKGF